MAYLEGEEPTPRTLKKCIRTGTLNGDFVPVLTGTAFKNKGVQPSWMPSSTTCRRPTDVEAIKGTSVDGETDMVRESSDDEPFSALAFKIMADPFVGTLTFCAHLLGHPREGRVGAQLGEGEARAHRPHAPDARQRPHRH